MKVLCVSDEIDPLIYSAHSKKRLSDIDFVISAGDLPMEYLGFIASVTCTPLYFVFGNHNLKWLPRFNKKQYDKNPLQLNPDSPLQNSFGAKYINKRCIRHEDLLLVGLGGCKRYNNGKNQFSELQMTFRIISLFPRLLLNRIFHGRFVDILVTHTPPKGIHDREDPCHQGFACFRWFIKWFKPRFMLHGHIHVYDNTYNRKTMWNNCAIINVFQSYTINL